MSDDTPSDDLPSQNGGLNIEGSTNIGGDAVGRDSISQTTTTTTNTNIAEGGPVARYAVIGLVVIAALAIVIIALLASQGPVVLPTSPPTASVTATLVPSQTSSATASPTEPPPTFTATRTDTPSPSATETPVPPTETPSPTTTPTQEETLPPGATEPATATPTPSATVTETASPTPTLTPWPATVVPLYDNFASSCLKKEKWMLDWAWLSPLPTPGAPVCLDTRPQFMAADDGLMVFLDSTVVLPKGASHALTSAQLGFYREVEVKFTLNQVEVFTDTRTAYLTAGVSVRLARPADADLEIQLQGSNASGRFGYQIVSLLTLKEGGNISGGKLPYTPGEPVVATFRVKGNKLTAYANGQLLAGPFSILSEPSAVNIGYHADPQSTLDGTFAEVRILQVAASEIATPAPANASARLITTVWPPPTPTLTRP